MKSLKKLRGLAGLKHIHHRIDKRRRQPMAQWEEIAQADQDIQDIKDCYDRLLSAAAATSNSAYELSESLQEIGDCLLEKTSLSNFEDEESGKVLLMLGKVELKLQRIVDAYRSHVARTITVPSESLLNELHTVQEMKSQCEEKRLAYEEALKKHKEKGKLKSAKVDCFHSHNLQAASDDYDQEVNSFLFRMKSLKQGQYRSLLTQAARHHAVQLALFKKGYLCLQAIEPHVRSIAKSYHIDYEFRPFEDDSGDDNDDEYGEGEDGDADADAGSSDGSELSFDCRLDHPRDLTMEDVQQQSLEYNIFAFRNEVKEASKSAPLFSDRLSDQNYKPEMRSPSSQKHVSYALPTPPEGKSPVTPVSARSKEGVTERKQASLSSINLYHSYPLDQNKYKNLMTNDALSGSIIFDTKSVLRDTNQNIESHPLTPPLLNGFSPPQVDLSFSSTTKKAKRYAFSGPLAGKPAGTASSPIGSARHPLLSGSVLRTLRSGPISITKYPSNTSSSFISSPKISELHELPRPPPHLAFTRTAPQFDYSSPLQPKGTEFSTANSVVNSADVSRHPMPPPLTRSYSIPTRGQITEPMVTEVPSPPLTPICLSTPQPPTSP